MWTVRAPLYVPTGVLDLSWSERVGGGSAVYEPGDVVGDAIHAAGARVVDDAQARVGVVLDSPGGADSLRMQRNLMGLQQEALCRGQAVVSSCRPVSTFGT